MAKKRVVVGSICKSKPDANGVTPPDYLKISRDVSLKQGQFLNLATKKQRLDSLESAAKTGKLTEEYVEKLRGEIEKTPDFVRFQVTTDIDV